MAEEVLRLRTVIIPDNAGLRQATQGLQTLGNTGKAATQQIKTGADSAIQSLRTMQRETAQFGAMINRVGALFGASFTAGAFAQKINQMTKEIVGLSHSTQELGLSERHVRALVTAYEKVGGSGDELKQSLRGVREALQGLNYAGSELRETMIQMGGREAAARLASIPDQGKRTIEFFRELQRLVEQGPTGRRRAEEIARSVGLPFEWLRTKMIDVESEFDRIKARTKEEEQAAKALQDQIIQLNKAWGEFALTTGQVVLPAITDGMNLMRDFIKMINQAVVDLGKLKGMAPEKAQNLPPLGQTPFRSWPMMLRELGPAALGLMGMGQKESAPAASPQKFQSGGIMTGTGLAMLHGPEAVIPLRGGSVPVELKGNRQEGERTVEEGTFQALVRFASYSDVAGTGGLGRSLTGGGGGGAGGAGTGAGGGTGLGGGQGGSQPGGVGQSNGQKDQSVSQSTPTSEGAAFGSGFGAFTPPEGGTKVPNWSEGGGGQHFGSMKDFSPVGTKQVGGGTIPPALLAQAKQMVLKGGKPPEVQAFLKKHGHNQNEAWCGHFAAAVVLEAGGKPPANPAVASNWRNWGTEVKASEAQPGDIAVRRGGRTGDPGSHVTIVGPKGFDPKTGRFEAVGGNQPSGVTGHKSSQYQFFRGADTGDKRIAAVRPFSAEGDKPATARESGGGRISGSGDVNEAIRATAGTAGMSEASWKAIADIESGLNPGSNRNRRTQYKGLFQVGTEEWRKHGGGGSQYDAMASAKAAATIAAENNKWFKQKFGRDPEPHETYLMHQQGRGFYSKGITTNLEGNRPPGYKGPLNRQTHEEQWKRVLSERTAKFTDKSAPQVADKPAEARPPVHNPPGRDGMSQSRIQSGELSRAEALWWATENVGLDERRDAGKLKQRMQEQGIKTDPRNIAWCASFTNAALASQGIKGTGSPAAASFVGYGTGIGADEVTMGDIGIVRGKSPRTGREGQHVGLLTGQSERRGNDLYLQMLAGNESPRGSGSQGMVAYTWRKASDLHLRRPPESESIDRANGNQTAVAASTINLDVRHDGTRASARARGNGPAFASTRIKNQTQMQPTADYGETTQP